MNMSWREPNQTRQVVTWGHQTLAGSAANDTERHGRVG